MLKVQNSYRQHISGLFTGIWDSMVTAYLQGYHGSAWVNKIPDPDFGFIVSGEYAFFGGNTQAPDVEKSISDIFLYTSNTQLTAIYSPDNLQWRDMLLKCHPGRSEEVMRYWIVQKDYDFDTEKLTHFAENIPEGYTIKQFDRDLYHQALNEKWSSEFCETFKSADDYLNKGFGFGITYNGILVSATSTMTVYDGGVEIQVATKENFKQKGLALPTAARFILECKKRNLRPCWDAANKISLHMAKKLGYEYNGEYSTVHIHR